MIPWYMLLNTDTYHWTQNYNEIEYIHFSQSLPIAANTTKTKTIYDKSIGDNRHCPWYTTCCHCNDDYDIPDWCLHLSAHLSFLMAVNALFRHSRNEQCIMPTQHLQKISTFAATKGTSQPVIELRFYVPPHTKSGSDWQNNLRKNPKFSISFS